MHEQETIDFITKTILEISKTKERNATLSGSRYDNGSKDIKQKLTYWLDGIEFVRTGKSDVYSELILQSIREIDPEYPEYLRLKEKFK